MIVIASIGKLFADLFIKPNKLAPASASATTNLVSYQAESRWTKNISRVESELFLQGPGQFHLFDLPIV
jgi:hypothetical protein